MAKFKPGSIRVLVREITLNFLFLLSASVEEMCPEEEYDNVVAAFKQLVEEYRNKFRKQFDADIWNGPSKSWLSVLKKSPSQRKKGFPDC